MLPFLPKLFFIWQGSAPALKSLINKKQMLLAYIKIHQILEEMIMITKDLKDFSSVKEMGECVCVHVCVCVCLPAHFPEEGRTRWGEDVRPMI